MPLIVRSPTPADVPVIADYNRRLARETEHTELDPAAVTAGVAAAIADPAGKGPYSLACDGDDVVGQMQVTFEWSDWRNGWFWWIQSVYVRADYRGRGVFRSLYDHVRHQARQAGNIIGIRLYVERDNRPAQETYRRLGMSEMPFYLMQELFSLNGLAPGANSEKFQRIRPAGRLSNTRPLRVMPVVSELTAPPWMVPGIYRQ